MRSIDNMVDKILDNQRVIDFLEGPIPLFHIFFGWMSGMLAGSAMIHEGTSEVSFYLLGVSALAYYLRALIHDLNRPAWDSIADIIRHRPFGGSLKN